MVFLWLSCGRFLPRVVLLFSLNYNLGATIYFRSLAFFHGRASAREGIFESFDGAATAGRGWHGVEVAAFTRFPRFLSRGREASGDASRFTTRLINDPSRKKARVFTRHSSPLGPANFQFRSLVLVVVLIVGTPVISLCNRAFCSSADIRLLHPHSVVCSLYLAALYFQAHTHTDST